ncbi:MAG TPA: nickel pincer cofactor biosynthesis protein LarB [Actinomycetota bacterium]|nr:nickel pincer cofactor biosynthesis protein LarB [Actinomycetota bacterium]
MRQDELKALLAGVADGSTSLDDAVAELRRLPLHDLGFARVDTHRELRQGMPEAIYAEHKTADHVVEIARALLERTSSAVIATRVPEETAERLLEEWPEARHDAEARLVVLRSAPDEAAPAGTVAVVTGGTSDRPVALEAALTAEAMGLKVERVEDVGVAGLHRVLAQEEVLRTSDVVIVVAGMEGALPSLVGGLTPAPVIAVPTSVGYGASLGGLAALLGMLNSCAAGLVVTNIDNGFGAAMAALRQLNRGNV